MRGDRKEASKRKETEAPVAGKKAAKKVAAKKTAAKKSAAKKAPGKKAAAKKMAAKHAGHAERDLRRAYEHMGRLEALGPLLSKDAASEIAALLRFAEGSLTANDAKSAAELLLAGEHLAFGSVAAIARDEGADERVRTAARDECEHLLNRAAEHWDEQSDGQAWPLDAIYQEARTRAEQALKSGALRRALEYARAAEALGHVEAAPVALPAGKKPNKLRG